jgi:bacterioferritin
LKDETASGGVKKVSRSELIELLNQDLAREYQAIIAYVVYSQVLKGAEFMNIAGELEKHAAQELNHALIIAKQIDYLGGMPTVEPKIVRTSEKAEQMLQFDLENETETIRHYRERVRQCEELSEYAMGEQIREILIDEQDHQIALPWARACQLLIVPNRNNEEFMSCQGATRIRISTWLLMMALAANQGGSNG